LGRAEIGVDDNFFELGGHSLSAVQVIWKLRELLQFDLSLRRFFEVPTLGGIAALVEQRPLRHQESLAEIPALVRGDLSYEDLLLVVDNLSDSETKRALDAHARASHPADLGDSRPGRRPHGSPKPIS
jgi:acyl carrier protein